MNSEQPSSLVANGYLIRAGKQPTFYQVFPGNISLNRGEEIVCRTPRGIEICEVLTSLDTSHPAPDQTSHQTSDSSLFDTADSDTQTAIDEMEASWPTAKWIRRSRQEDKFLLSKLEEMSLEASQACQQFLDEHNSNDVLLEVEPLLDGRTLYFHFLGEPSEETELVIDKLANEYQSTVAKSRFAELVEKGCGPGCGTKEKSGCGTSQGCAVCAIAGGCTKK